MCLKSSIGAQIDSFVESISCQCLRNQCVPSTAPLPLCPTFSGDPYLLQGIIFALQSRISENGCNHYQFTTLILTTTLKIALFTYSPNRNPPKFVEV
ncbi:hypothetical protein ACTXT7_001363 [Hymenolepis weldensis]